MESQKAVALYSKLYKTEEEEEEQQQIFLGFRILKQEQKETKETSNKAKCFWIFRIAT